MFATSTSELISESNMQSDAFPFIEPEMAEQIINSLFAEELPELNLPIQEDFSSSLSTPATPSSASSASEFDESEIQQFAQILEDATSSSSSTTLLGKRKRKQDSVTEVASIPASNGSYLTVFRNLFFGITCR
jgi:hypothetical protein